MPEKPTRREILAAGIALSALPSVVAQTPAIIDTHIHLWDTNRPGGVAWPPESEILLYRPVLPADYIEMVRPLGVTGAVVIEASPRLEDNQWVLDLVKDNPMFVAYVGHLSPGTENFRRDLARFIKNPLFRGIRLAGAEIIKGVTQPRFMEDLQRLAEANLMMDALGDTTMIAPLTLIAQKLPRLRIAIDHMPLEPAGWKPDAMRELASHRQIYCKVSGVLKRVGGKVPLDLPVYRTSLDELWALFGPDRVMYGSNWPVSDKVTLLYADVLVVAKQYAAKMTAADSDKFFSRNAKACYQWT